MMNKQIVPTVLKAIAVAMAIAVIVMSTMVSGLAAQTADLLLGIGLFALAISALQK
jgi:hypothetical protein